MAGRFVCPVTISMGGKCGTRDRRARTGQSYRHGLARLCLCGLLLTLLTGGCSLAALTEQLESRQVQSCVYTWGFLTPFYAVRVVSATGGMTVHECHGLR